MKDELKKDFQDILTMGKGAISFGEEKLKQVTDSDSFKKFDSDLKNEIGKMEESGKKIKDDLMSRGQEKDKKEENK